MSDKRIYDTIIESEPISKGWSDDKKFCVETANGQRLLLRVSEIDEQHRKGAEYNMMERAFNHGIPTSRPVEFGYCDDGKSVYQLSEWLDGEDVDAVMPLISKTEQYVIGLKAGEVLHKLHNLPAPKDAEPWANFFYRKVQGRIDFYNSNPIKSENGDIVVRYLKENRHLLNGRPQTFNHGDYNRTNLMLLRDGRVGVIDFNYYNKDYGDPWWEFDPTNWGGEVNRHFCTGQLRGYFDGAPPQEFFTMFSYYLAYDALAALCDTSEHNQGEPEEGQRHLENILRWFNNMKNPVPTWYLDDVCVE